MTRFQFLRSLAHLGLAAAVLPACKKADDDDGSTPAPDAGMNPSQPDARMSTGADAANDAPNPTSDAPVMPTCNSTTSMIGLNHGHALAVPAADVTAGVEKLYSIQGTALHGHTVRITSAGFATLRQAGTLDVLSSLDGHQHAVTVNCA
jgi:hypothetical protein